MREDTTTARTARTARTRALGWLATGALLAAATTLAVVHTWRADAANTGQDSTFVPIDPCRLADTRPAPNHVGVQNVLDPGETTRFPVHGTNGNCTLPNDAVAVSMNVTALNAAELTFLTIWSGEGQRPTAASLNPAPGEPPTPNAVVTPLSAAGGFDVYNDVGTVNVVIDINGYHTRRSLDAIQSGGGVIPSGVTVTGWFNLDDTIGNQGTIDDALVAFPQPAPAVLTDQQVNFGVGTANATDVDPACTGSANAPTAPPGRVCLYVNTNIGVGLLEGRQVYLTGMEAKGFRLLWQNVGPTGSDRVLVVVWAYTAP